MNHLLYASDEMFSSTQLIRKSKDIFDKLGSSKIEKAVILRDGKPNFILIDFHKYEKIMKEYIELKDKECNKIQTKSSKVVAEEPIELKVDFSSNFNEENEVKTEEVITGSDEIDQEELEYALAQIEALDLDEDLKNEAKEKIKEKSTAQIKEFWN
jgi:hypothetical protein